MPFLKQRIFFKISVIACFVCWMTNGACKNPAEPGNGRTKKDSAVAAATDMAKDLSGKFSDQTELKFDSAALKDFFSTHTLLAPYKNDVELFYRKRNFSFAWYDHSGLIEQAGNFYSRASNLPAEGIAGEVPYLKSLDSLLVSTDTVEKKQQPETELLLSGLYFYFAHKVWDGLGEDALTKAEWYVPRKKISYERWLDSLLRSPDGFSHAREPIYRQYGLLRSVLQKYRDLEKNARWIQIAADKKAYRLNDSSGAVRQLKTRLFLLGDLAVNDSTEIFDSTLQVAVKNFQHRYGIKEDGIAGASMFRELNMPLSSKIEKILVNMERTRWLPMSVSGEYVGVNIPEFKLHLFENDSLLWSMDVVVGTAVSKTVIFSGKLKYVVFSPYWNVPTSIYKKEVLPGIQKNKNYLATHHMEKSGNGVRQTPGPWNSLGQVKFLFPNSFSIYFHDTPAKTLFSESKRDFSHGCIRLAEPKKMAAYLLRNDTSWTDKKITASMNAGKEKYVTLAKELPVFITYFTAWVDRKGQLNLREDIYNRDKRLTEMLMGR
ncbi:MAG: L,D-transpeptidase family protein [Chitinophagaceae bacterium]